ncbi:MAG TPA: cysteine--tRNA ligase [Syntrophales bacterium]|nr:cysteine--tRNA ligase [Syntrophales bacterium]HOL58907.1 cysteine--tRNA ligase [Syntrophales bacterium]HPO35234.1 cysteine--tRNA ligase [Syntrophales bacterium]
MEQSFYQSILEAIGHTPLVEIRRLNPNKRVKILAKMESFNPGGSIKDRTALYMIEGAERRGELKPGMTILEATSGNTGIGLALVAAAKGYRLCLTMSEGVSEERKKILRALGAELVLTPAHLGTDGAIEVAYRLLRENPGKYFCTDQFNNLDNVRAHYEGTAEEIWQQTGGQIDAVVVALGTTGTAMGLSRRLKELNPAIKIIGVEPYLKHRIQGLKNMKESYRPGIYDRRRLDEKVNILDEEAFAMARRLVREEGLFVGMSSGAAMHVAAQKAKEMEEGVIVVIFPDGGERYLSTDLFVQEEVCPVSLYNALTRTKERLKPGLQGEILMHTCGPTVHDVPHLGSYRRFVVSDLLRRYLVYRGYKVKNLTNIIDLADRTIQGAIKEGVEIKSYAERYMEIFFSDLKKLRVVADAVYPRASEHVDEMLKMVEKLEDKGFAYEKLHSVYFDISKLDSYGSLSNIDLRQVRSGKTVDFDDYEKDSPVDFTLLKRATLNELKQGVYYSTKWGAVRPSWHVECAAMAIKYLGDHFHVHVGGEDILFPHCENVLAIGQALTGRPLADHWVNAALVMVEGKKMSRSLANCVTLSELEERGFSGREVRLFLLMTHYRKPLNYSPATLIMARNTLRRIDHFVNRICSLSPGKGEGEAEQWLYDLRQGFHEAMDDDLNVAGAMASFFTFVKKVNKTIERNTLSAQEKARILEFLRVMDSVLGIFDFPEEHKRADIEKLLAQREALRREKKWREADEIRARLKQMGVEVIDTPQGTWWRREKNS